MLSAGHKDQLSGDEIGTQQKDQGVGNLLRRPYPLRRNLVRFPLQVSLILTRRRRYRRSLRRELAGLWKAPHRERRQQDRTVPHHSNYDTRKARTRWQQVDIVVAVAIISRQLGTLGSVYHAAPWTSSLDT
jgi:hypothetical protein